MIMMVMMIRYDYDTIASVYDSLRFHVSSARRSGENLTILARPCTTVTYGGIAHAHLWPWPWRACVAV